MTNIETISAKELNKIMKSDPALYNDLIHGKNINIRNDAVKPVAITTTGTKTGVSTGTSTGRPIFKIATWSDYSQAELIQMRRSNNELFLMLLEAESKRHRRK